MGLIESNDLFEEELVDNAKKDKLTVKWIQKASKMMKLLMFWSRKTHFQFLDPIRLAPTAQKDFRKIPLRLELMFKLQIT